MRFHKAGGRIRDGTDGYTRACSCTGSGRVRTSGGGVRAGSGGRLKERGVEKFSIKGLVIRADRVGERDRAVTLLTGERGLLRAFAPGAGSVKGKTAAGAGLLSYGEYQVTRSRDTYRISEFQPLASFFKVAEDIESLAVAQYFCEVARHITREEEPAGFVLPVILNALWMLDGARRPPAFIKAVTELRLMAVTGFCPDLACCAACGRTGVEGFLFAPGEGCLFCPGCLPERAKGMPVPGATLRAMRYICQCPPEKLYSFTLPDGAARCLYAAAESFLVAQTDRDYRTLEFYHSL